MIKAKFELSSKLSFRTLVNFEFLYGMCFLKGSDNAVMHCPRALKLLLIDVNS